MQNKQAGARLIRIPTVNDARGSLVHIESQGVLPFDVKRTYFTHGMPEDAVRGGHAHRQCEEFLIAASGSFRVTLTDSAGEKTFILDDPSTGLYVPTMTWRVLDGYTKGAVCLVLSSLSYDERDYYRDFDPFEADLANAENPIR